ncbi:hypothetical protein EOPP23_12500 [Endozoicomonas sp. OPT23]|uniref:hypothetical protein n=1 Tax=Endozoicomonas sp. OPT23 TaxID=2072845 RepID=UPI00129B6631|nr:hypothetical protein [Endozoicomonas sp. OPT23]MRI33806.1 hypothetical protein [Endozoicomonas sp. OPT23]
MQLLTIIFLLFTGITFLAQADTDAGFPESISDGLKSSGYPGVYQKKSEYQVDFSHFAPPEIVKSFSPAQSYSACTPSDMGVGIYTASRYSLNAQEEVVMFIVRVHVRLDEYDTVPTIKLVDIKKILMRPQPEAKWSGETGLVIYSNKEARESEQDYFERSGRYKYSMKLAKITKYIEIYSNDLVCNEEKERFEWFVDTAFINANETSFSTPSKGHLKLFYNSSSTDNDVVLMTGAVQRYESFLGSWANTSRLRFEFEPVVGTRNK